MEYYIVKSGMQMYDLSRAYGLGEIIANLSGSSVEVKDLGSYYLVESMAEPQLIKTRSLASLLPQESDKKWGNVFLTLKGKNREREIKECKKMIIDEKLISSLLDRFKDVQQSEFFASKNNKKTLYESLDLSATKGFREMIRGRTYDEGRQLYVPKEDFLLSVVGHLNYTIWKWKMDGRAGQLIMILFTPSAEGIRIGGTPTAREIPQSIDRSLKPHRGGITSTLAYTAVLLGRHIFSAKEKIYLKFSSLIFGVMISSGKQRKPYGGGIYPLDFVYKIIKSSERAGEIFDQWIDIFEKTNRPGYEDLALYLSEFITYPTADTFERYLRAHLGTYLNKDIKPKLYESEILQEVEKCLEK